MGIVPSAVMHKFFGWRSGCQSGPGLDFGMIWINARTIDQALVALKLRPRAKPVDAYPQLRNRA
jgi:hypothetical protein